MEWEQEAYPFLVEIIEPACNQRPDAGSTTSPAPVFGVREAAAGSSNSSNASS